MPDNSEVSDKWHQIFAALLIRRLRLPLPNALFSENAIVKFVVSTFLCMFLKWQCGHFRNNGADTTAVFCLNGIVLLSSFLSLQMLMN